MLQRKFTHTAIVALFATLLLSACATKKAPTAATPPPGASKDGIKSIKDLTKNAVKQEGLFTMYRDTINGTAYILIKEDQLDKEFIWFGHIMDGVLDAGYFRGSYGPSKIFSINKYYEKLEFTLENTDYYFNPENALSKASKANINRPIIHSQKIQAMNSDKNEFLIKADDLFLSESFQQVKYINPMAKPGMFGLGGLSKDKNKYVQIKNYPKNTDVVVEYVYENPYPTGFGSDAVTDSRFVSVKMQHSIIEVPENGYSPRYDDPRVGYFTTQVTDMTSPSATPYRDLVHRWHLVKKDPAAALSEPVEPIVWWIENTTPVEYRETITDAVLAWNEAFEKAGFKNAVQVKVQPDDADWDAGDIRYNVIRWTSSPQPPFGGYGPSFVNPRSGQILGADVMLEYVFLTNRYNLEKLYNTTGTEAMEMHNGDFNKNYCSAINHLHHSNLFGKAALTAMGASEKETELVKEAIYYLVLHEVGHTMGLNHNMKSSQLHSPKDINNKSMTSKVGLTGSVMDYPAINISPNKEAQGQFYTTKPGPYDLWAIEFAYSPALDNADAEASRLNKILSRSSEANLAFGNDADDMRSPGGGIDPRVMISDLTNDAITYSVDRIKLVNSTYPKLLERYRTDGNSYQEMLIGYYMLNGEKTTQLGVISRYIGGIYVDRSKMGQTENSMPYTPVAYEDQKRAMKALADNAFAPDAYKVHNEIYNYLQHQRRGFSHYGKNEDPKLHDQVLNSQKYVLAHLTHKNLMKRLTDSKLYGNKYALDEFMTDMTNSIFQEDLKTDVNTFRRNLQVEYIDRLSNIINDKNGYDNISQAMALHEMNRVKGLMRAGANPNAGTKAHRDYIIFKIDSAIEAQKNKG